MEGGKRVEKKIEQTNSTTMPKYALKMKANLTNLEQVGAPSDPEFRWYLGFTCSNCGETSEGFHYLSLGESVPGRKRGSTKNLQMKCKLCSRETSVNILQDYIKPFVANDRDEFQTIAAFECRGTLEPIKFSPRGGWVAKTIDGGTVFTDVDLNDEWSDYCEKVEKPVVICDLQFAFADCN